MRADSLKNILN